MKIVVIGGTGLIGSKVVTRINEQGHEAVPASPRRGVNTITGEGLAATLRGAAVVVDVSNSPSFDYAPALEFFATSTHHLLVAEAAAGVRHHIALSVVGTKPLAEGGDLSRTTAGYFLAKLVEEALIQAAEIPYSIVHATQFFEFVPQIIASAVAGDCLRLPPVLFQPMAAEDVAAAVCRVALGTPRRGIVEVGGPEIVRLDLFIQRALAAMGDERTVIADPAAGYFGAKVSERTLIPTDGAKLGETRYDDWRAASEQLAATSAA
ncbi:MAG TPA: SDR family oxidoreductase [Candidatus Limnocylindrales bacterium]|nr:SDR family oxidoreductase [Candidatus Limnocylindrales bacterium]